MKLSKTILLALICLMLSAFFVACGSKGISSTDKDGTAGIDRLVQYFKDNGIIVGSKTEKAYQMIGAKAGFAIEVSGSIIELYQFDVDNLSEDAKKMLKSAADDGKASILGTEISAASNNDLLMCNYDDNNEKDKILELFNKFK